MASCGSKLCQKSPIAQKTKVIYFLLLPQSSWIWSLWWRTERPPWTFDHRPFDHKYSQKCDSLWGNFHRITAGVQTVNHGSFWITSSPGCQCPHRTGHLQPFSSWKGNKLGENTNHSKFRNCQNWHKNYFDVKTCTYLRDFFRLEKRFLGARGDAGIPPPPPFSKHIVIIKIMISIFITIIEVKHIYTFTDHPSHSWSSVVTSWLIRPALSPAMQESDLWENFDVSLKFLVCFKEFSVLICPGQIQPVKNSRFLLRKRTVA